MSTSVSNNPVQQVLVGMGQIAAGEAPQRMRAILGSCVGLALYHSKCRTGAMAHIVLPDSAGRDGAPGKFADTAVPSMLQLLRRQGLTPAGMSAKLAGGANMFNGSGPLQIGNTNIEAVRKALKAAGIPIVGEDVGGAHGRRIEFDCSNGNLTVQGAGRTQKII
jgi:chemotaxis protein CheD